MIRQELVLPHTDKDIRTGDISSRITQPFSARAGPKLQGYPQSRKFQLGGSPRSTSISQGKGVGLRSG